MSRLRTLEHHFDIAPALVQASALEAAGVPCFIANYQICSTLPFQAIALGGVRVDVADADLTRAREVLAELQASPPEEMSASEPTDICPKCRSSDVFRGLWLPLALATGWFLGAPIGWKGHRECRNCGHQWRRNAKKDDFDYGTACPNCGSREIGFWRLAFGNLISRLRSFPEIDSDRPNLECQSCGARWREGPPAERPSRF